VAAPKYLIDFWLEELKWRKQKTEEDKKWQREEQRKEREHVRDLYQKTLVNLSILLTLLKQSQIETKEKRAELKEKGAKIIDDIHDWSTLLLLRHSDKALLKCVDDFILDPDDTETENLRNKVLEVAQRENELFPISAPSDAFDKPKEISGRKEITVFIDESVRRECAKLGHEIARTHELHCFLIDMTPSQREKIFDGFSSCEFIPEKFELRIPKPEIGSMKEYRNMKPWLSASRFCDEHKYLSLNV
jgi:hypothetical protein